MENLKNPAVMGRKIYKLLEEKKILLMQDKNFPSIVNEITEQTITGSWWGHPLANPIYNGLLWLDENRNVLAVKLVDGKVTYIHESLFSDFYSIVCEPRDWQIKRLTVEEVKILELIRKSRTVQSDDSRLSKLAKDSKKVLTALEKRLLVFSKEEHTDSGKHVKEYSTWAASKLGACDKKDYAASIERIGEIVSGLCETSGAKVRLPWGSPAKFFECGNFRSQMTLTTKVSDK